MIKRNSRYYLVRGIVLAFVGLGFLLSYAVVTSTTSTKAKEDNLTYVSYEILTDNAMPVSKQEETQTSDITRPYTDEKVEVGKSYYDYDSESESQEKSIVYYEDTYIQNTGVDYTSKEVFDVNAIADGTVVSITKDDIVCTE